MIYIFDCPYENRDCTPPRFCEDCANDHAEDAAAFRDFMVETDKQIAPSDYVFEYDPAVALSENTYSRRFTEMINAALDAQDAFSLDELEEYANRQR